MMFLSCWIQVLQVQVSLSNSNISITFKWFLEKSWVIANKTLVTGFNKKNKEIYIILFYLREFNAKIDR